MTYGLPGGGETRPFVGPIARDRHIEIPRGLLYPGDKQPGFRYGEGRRRQTVYVAPGVELVDPQGPGSRIPGLDYANSEGWAIGTDQKLWERVRRRAGSDVTAAFFELLIQEEIGDKTIQLKHIVSGINPVTAYSYRDFGYISRPTDPI